MSGDGSANNPYGRIEDIIAAKLIQTQDKLGTIKNPSGKIKPGDRILLRTGEHGSFFVRGYFNQNWITVAAESGEFPVLSRIEVQGGARWRFEGLSVVGSPTARLVQLETHGTDGPVSDIELRSNTIASTLDSGAWSADDWDQQADTGIDIIASRVLVDGNTIFNVNSGIELVGNDTIISNNNIDRFLVDGITGGGNRILLENNRITNVVRAKPDTHNDGIQIHRGANPCNCNDITIRGNVVIQNTDPSSPFPGTLQGITDFSSPNNNWLIENNVVLVDHNHGITVEGLTNSIIRHNTVLRRNANSGFATPIKIYNDPSGTYLAGGNLVLNNLATSISVSPQANTVTCNLALGAADPDSYFTSFANQDVSLKAESPARDVGCAGGSPYDILGAPRDSTPDLGAYEYIGN